MLIGGIVLGLLAGLALGGKFGNLGDIRLRWLPLLFLAVILRFGTEAALGLGIPLAETLRLPLFAGAYGLLLAGLWHNRQQPGLSLAFVGILSNALVIVINGGHMLIWEPSLVVAGFDPERIDSVFHTVIPAGAGADFLLRAGLLGDIIPIPLPFIANVASIGDVFLTAGLGFFLFAVVLRPPESERDAEPGQYRGLAGTARLPRTLDAALGRTADQAPAVRPATGLSANLQDTAALDRPLLLGTPGAGLAAPALAPLPAGDAADRPLLRPSEVSRPLIVGQLAVADAGAIVLPAPSRLERARQHPYVRLALNGSFSALWTGQLVSLFGDRMHLIALSYLVLSETDSVLASALVFVAATGPNLFLSPIAGVFVDRWDKQQVMVVSDLLRAGLVLLIPVVASVNVVLVYPFAALITAVSIFFRPARAAILPRIVRDEDLLPANSALWVGETLADVIGTPLAALFVTFLGSALSVAFWFDAATYVASAVLIGTMIVPPVAKRTREAMAHRATRAERAATGAETALADDDTATDDDRATLGSVLDDLRVGWRFLRNEAVLLTNTIQGAIGQFGSGMLIALTPAYALQLVGDPNFQPAAYGFLEAGLGVGNLVGGFVIGLVGARLRKGWLVVSGYVACGIGLILLSLAGNLPLAILVMTIIGIANMTFIIPSQTLFQERTPEDMIGRVVGFRFAAVFGSTALAMGVGGVLGELATPMIVIALGGVIQIGAGILGALQPETRAA